MGSKVQAKVGEETKEPQDLRPLLKGRGLGETGSQWRVSSVADPISPQNAPIGLSSLLCRPRLRPKDSRDKVKSAQKMKKKR